MKPYNIHDSYVLRTPYLEFELLDELKNLKDEETLKKICDMEWIKEAIYVTSPNLHQKLINWQNNNLTREKDIKNLKYTIMEYLIRMSSRCTPFGLFSGISVGQFDGQEQIIRNTNDVYKHLRLDMDLLFNLSILIQEMPEIREHLHFFPNTSIYKRGDQLRYIEYNLNKARREYNFVEIDDSEYIQSILQAATNGKKISDLAHFLLSDDSVSQKEAINFVTSLIDNQILVSELEPTVTGEEFYNIIIDIINRIDKNSELSKTLWNIKTKIETLKKTRVSSSVNDYKQIEQIIEEFSINQETKNTFQADIKLAYTKNTLSSDLKNSIIKGAKALNAISDLPAINFSSFKSQFLERFGDKEIPLLKVLDSEIGISYGQGNASFNKDYSPLLDGITFQLPNNQKDSVDWNPVQQFVFEKYKEALYNGHYSIQINNDDFDFNKISWSDLPDTFSSTVELYKTDELDNYQIYMNMAGNPSATNLLGRFCHVDEDINRLVSGIAAHEKELNKDKIVAEIAHLPENRIGNVILRPDFRDYEIPFMAQSGKVQESQIPLNDLYVSIKNNRVLLRSKRLNKEIIPRHSNAYSFNQSKLPVYRFLCDLQFQNKKGGLRFSWGFLDNQQGFLPRVEYENIILSKATWNLSTKELKGLDKTSSDDELLKKFNTWIDKHKINKEIVLADGDNTLYFDLSKIYFIRTFLDVISKRSTVKLQEFLFNNENMIVKDDKNKSYTNQFIFIFTKSPKQN